MKAKLFMDKYGIKYTTLNTSILTKDIKMLNGFHNKDWLAWASHNSFDVYDNGSAHTIQPDGTYVVDDVEHKSRAYYFIDKPDESIYHILSPLYQGYEADHNKYGFLDVSNDVFEGTDDDDTSFIKADWLEVTSWTEGTVTNMKDIIEKFAALYQQSAGHSSGNTAGFLNLSLTGSKLAADIDLAEWPLAKDLGSFKNTGFSKTIIDNGLLNWCISKAF
jgi:hypothetical protein